MFDNIIQNQGFTIALSGILVVFSGLILIALVIHTFNKVFEKQTITAAGESDRRIPQKRVLTPKGKPVPEDHTQKTKTICLPMKRP